MVFKHSATVLAIFFCLCVPFVREGLAMGSSPQPGAITLPPGFRIAVYAGDVPGARSMTLGPNGTLFVGSRGEGKVYAILDRNGDNMADEVLTIAKGLNMPNGVAFLGTRCTWRRSIVFFAMTTIESRLSNPPPPVVVNDSFPKDRHHGWKFIRFGPDGLLYVPVGAPCNICESEDPRYASIMRMKRDGTGLEIFARGVRNTVGFDWHPVTKELWFTDNGRDWMGDDRPPDELNHAPEKGMHFGYPYCHGTGIPDPEFGKGKSCQAYTPPAHGAWPPRRFPRDALL